MQEMEVLVLVVTEMQTQHGEQKVME